MEKKLSKHGKYWIITGTPEELYDEMQPGDLVKTSKGTWWELSHHVDIEDLPLSLRIVAELYDPDSIWLEKDTESGKEYLAAYRKDFVLKIKRPVAVNTILGNYTLLGTLTGDAPFTEKPEAKKEEPEATKPEPEQEKKTLPEDEGFYTDTFGDLWWFGPDDEGELRYIWFGFSDESSYHSVFHVSEWYEMPYKATVAYAPFRRVTHLSWRVD